MATKTSTIASGGASAPSRDRSSAGFYERLARPLLFRLDAETAHRLGQFALAREFPWSLARAEDSPRLAVTIGDWQIASPIGLAAGFDKGGGAIAGLQHLGFGYLSIGSILPEPSAGHPRPRLLRYVEDEALANCYGLPSEGLDAAVARFRRLSPRRPKLIANIHTDSVTNYVRCAAALAPSCDGVELALRCPNRSDHIAVYPIAELDELLGAVQLACPKTALFAKLPPYANDEEKENRFALIERAIHFGLAGVTIQGNWSVADARLSRGQGSLSGRPTFPNNLKVVREIAAAAQGRIAVKASGGVHTGEDALQMLEAGASMIEIFTSFVYRGRNVAAKIKRELLALMDEHGIATVADLIRAR